jgi:hypothetical protein
MKTISPKPNCPRCHGRGYIGIDIHTGKKIPCQAITRIKIGRMVYDKIEKLHLCRTNKGINKEVA